MFPLFLFFGTFLRTGDDAFFEIIACFVGAVFGLSIAAYLTGLVLEIATFFSVSFLATCFLSLLWRFFVW